MKRQFIQINFLVLMMVFTSILSTAQGVFQKTYGGVNDDDTRHITHCQDGAFLVAGSTLSYGGGSTDAYLLKVDESGNVLWSKTYGGIEDDYFEWAEPTHDNGFIACGFTFSVVKQDFKISVIKTDSNGVIQWQKRISLAAVSRAYCIRETYDHGFVFCGEEDSSSVDGNMLIVKLDSLGNLEWNKSYGIPSNTDAGYCIVQTKDSGIAVCGQSRYGLYSSFAVLLKTDIAGNLEWGKYYYFSNPVNNRSYPNRIIELEGGGFVVSGSSYLIGQPLSNILLFTTDSSGTELWSKLYSTGTGDVAHDLIVLPKSNGFVLCGYTSSPHTGTTNALVLKTDRNGNSLWNESYGNDTIDGNFYSCILNNANSILLTGTTYSFGAGGQDIVLTARDSAGISSECNTHAATFSTLAFPLTDYGTANLVPLTLAVNTSTYSSSAGVQSFAICLSTGREESIQGKGFNIYPNPGNQFVNIENRGVEKINSLNLLDATGRIVRTKIIHNEENKVQLEIADISPGIYWIEIRTKNERVTRKFVAN